MNRKARWIWCCGSCFVVMGLLLGSGILFAFLSNREISAPLEVRNPAGSTGQMLVIYRPGISAFPNQIMEKFVEGAISKDWVVTISVVSAQSPMNITGYDLMMFLSPVYGGMPQKHITAYISSLDLLNKPCVVITTSGGGASIATENMTTQIQVVNGIVVAQASYGQFESRSLIQNAAYQLGANQTLIDAISG